MLGVSRQKFEREMKTARLAYVKVIRLEAEEPLNLEMGGSGRIVGERPQ